MEVVFSYATLVALVGAVALPVCVSFAVWGVYWLRFYAAEMDERQLPRSVLEMVFAGQHYRFMVLQPLDWAVPYVLMLAALAIPGGILIDNGFVVGWGAFGGLCAMLLICFVCVTFMCDDNTVRYPPWWLDDPAMTTYFFVAMLAGIAIENWLV